MAAKLKGEVRGIRRARNGWIIDALEPLPKSEWYEGSGYLGSPDDARRDNKVKYAAAVYVARDMAEVEEVTRLIEAMEVTY